MSQTKSQKIRLKPLNILSHFSIQSEERERSISEVKNKRSKGRYRTKTEGGHEDQGEHINEQERLKGRLSSVQPAHRYLRCRIQKGDKLKNFNEVEIRQQLGIETHQISELTERSFDKADSSIRVRQVERKELPTKEHVPKSKTVHPQKIPVPSLLRRLANILSLLKCIMQKSQLRKLVIQLKQSLKDDSNFSQFEEAYEDTLTAQSLKTMLYFERVVMILSVQAIIYGKYRLVQVLLKNILIDFVWLFCSLLADASNKPFAAILQQPSLSPHLESLSVLLSASKKHPHPPSFLVLKDQLYSKLKLITRNFRSTHNHMRCELAAIDKTSLQQLHYNLLQFFASSLAGGNWVYWEIQLLETCPAPYLDTNPLHEYTLLLDLDETLVHYEVLNMKQGRFLIRPHLFEFLEQLATHFEIGIFTCGLQQYADTIVQHMKEISFRLYRQHALRINNELVKDLSRVGRDLSKLIIVDNLSKNYQLQEQNGIHIRSWYGDNTDNILPLIACELIQVAREAPQDIRKHKFRRSFK